MSHIVNSTTLFQKKDLEERKKTVKLQKLENKIVGPFHVFSLNRTSMKFP